MNKKQYMITLASTADDKMYSTFFSRRRGFLFIFLGIFIFIGISFLLSLFIESSNSNHIVRNLERENALLKESFANFENRSKELRTQLDEIKKRNLEIRTAAALPISEPEYGVGGSKEITRAGYNEIQEIKDTELNIAALETELDFLKKNVTELEETISSRMQQIAHYPSIRPVRGGWISSYFGKRLDPFTGETENHKAIDISIQPGTEVYAPAAGVVEYVNTRVIKNKGYGKYVIIDHGNGYKTLYGHLSKIFLKKGQQIKRWDLVALTGNTGKSTAPHIHYEVIVNGRQRNPLDFILE